mgnify:CR=1 FL=1
MQKQDRMLSGFLNGLTKLMKERKDGKITEKQFFAEYDKLSNKYGVKKLARMYDYSKIKGTTIPFLDTGTSEDEQRRHASFEP